jgi:hypothetical protein
MSLGSKSEVLGLYFRTMNYQTINFMLQEKPEDTPMKNGETGMNSGIGKLQDIRSF